MTLDEFYTEFQAVVPKFKWQTFQRESGNVIRTVSKDGDSIEICHVTAVCWNKTKILFESWNVYHAGKKLGLTKSDIRLIICAADQEILLGITQDEMENCRARLLAITQLQ